MLKSGENELFPNTAWQLLLPDVTPLALETIGPASPRLAAPIALHQGSGSPSHRLAIVAADDFDDLRLDHLPGVPEPVDVAYLEAPLPRLQSVNELRQQLVHRGFSAHALYSVSPAPDRWQTTWWIPVGHADQARFVADRLHTGRRAVRNWREGPQRLTAAVTTWRPSAVAERPWLLHPQRPQHVCVVATRDGGPAGHDCMPDLARRAAMSLGRPPDTPAQVVLRVGGSSTDQPIMFVFLAGAATPSVVVKAPTRSEEIEATTREAALYTHLARLAPNLSGIPRSVNIQRQRPPLVFGQNFVPGLPLTRFATKQNFAQLADRVTTWAIDLALATRAQMDEGWQQGVVVSALRAMKPLVDGSTGGSDMLQQLDQALGEAVASFSVCHHNDFGPWNIHLDDAKGIGVVDWADARTSGPPLCDLVYFLTHLGLCTADAYAPRRRSRVIAGLLDRESNEGSIAHRSLTRYCEALDIGAMDLKRLRLLTWVLKYVGETPERREGSLYLELLDRELCGK